MRDAQLLTIMDAKADEGIGTTMDVTDYRTITVSIAAIGVTGGDGVTIKCQGSIQNDVAFGSTASATNAWDNIQMIKLLDATAVDGDDGLALTADLVGLYEINTNGLTRLNFILSAITGAVAVTIKAVAFTNQ